jgi:hypothetical protein
MQEREEWIAHWLKRLARIFFDQSATDTILPDSVGRWDIRMQSDSD